MNCNACGAPLTTHAAPCPRCGTQMHPPVPGYGAPPPPPGPEKASGYGRAYGHQPQSYVVQPWAAPPVVQPQPWYNNLGGGSFFLLRLAIVAAVVVLVGVGSCVAAIAR